MAQKEEMKRNQQKKKIMEVTREEMERHDLEQKVRFTVQSLLKEKDGLERDLLRVDEELNGMRYRGICEGLGEPEPEEPCREVPKETEAGRPY